MKISFAHSRLNVAQETILQWNAGLRSEKRLTACKITNCIHSIQWIVTLYVIIDIQISTLSLKQRQLKFTFEYDWSNTNTLSCIASICALLIKRMNNCNTSVRLKYSVCQTHRLYGYIIWVNKLLSYKYNTRIEQRRFTLTEFQR